MPERTELLARICAHPFRYMLYNICLAIMFFAGAECIISLKLMLAERQTEVSLLNSLLNILILGVLPFSSVYPVGLMLLAALLALARFTALREKEIFPWLVVFITVLTVACGGLVWSIVAAVHPDGDMSSFSVIKALLAAWLSVGLSSGIVFNNWSKSVWSW